MECCDELANCLDWLNCVKTGRELISATGSLPVSIAWEHVPSQDMAARYEPQTQVILVSGSARDYLTGARLLSRELQLSRHHLQFGTINLLDSFETYTARRIAANVDAEGVAATLSVELARKGSYQAVFRAMKSPEASDIYRKVEPFCWKILAPRIEVYKTARDAFLAVPHRVRKLVGQSQDDWNALGREPETGIQNSDKPSTVLGRNQPILDTYGAWVTRVEAELPDLRKMNPFNMHEHASHPSMRRPMNLIRMR